LQITTSDYTSVQKCPVSPVGNTEEPTLTDTSSWLHGEASIDDFMADPIVQLVVESDQVSVGELRALIGAASTRHTQAREEVRRDRICVADEEPRSVYSSS
jgi:hypothetical protein